MKKHKKKKALGVVGLDKLGFELVKFYDGCGNLCRLEIINFRFFEKPGVCLGLNDAQHKIFAQDAEKLGIFTDQKSGLIPYKLPDEVLHHARMYLSRKQVKSLIAHLQAWLSKGTFELQHD